MQNKALVYGVALVAIVILGLGAWMVVGKGGTSTTAPNGQTQNTTLKGLLAMNTPQKCTFSSATAQSNSSGTVFVASGQMRGDFSSFVAGKTTESHMIVKDGISYVWTDASPQGFKMSFDAVATQSDANPQPSVDPNAQLDYSCAAWTSDASLFATPTDITFRDMSDLMPNGNSGAGANIQSGMSVQCGQCDMIQDANAKAQCKVALKCK